MPGSITGRLVSDEPTGPQLARYATYALVFADEVVRAQQEIADVRADTVSRGSIDAQLSGLTWRALLALRRASWPRQRQTRERRSSSATDTGSS